MAAKNQPIVVWIRKDLRLSDNPALAWAAKQRKPLIIVFIADANNKSWSQGSASLWWLHHSLDRFEESLKRAGGSLYLFAGEPEGVLRQIIAQTSAQAVVWNRRYEPDSIAIDSKIKKSLSEDGLNVKSFPGNVCHEPWQVKRGDSHPYKVFSAYWRASLKHESLPVSNRVRTVQPYQGKVSGAVTLAALQLLPRINWAKDFPQHWQPGEQGAEQQLEKLIKTKVTEYQTARDLPALDGTSRLSPHLAFGEISPRTIQAAIRKSLLSGELAEDDNTEAFLREIGWREFACHLLYHFPKTTDEPLDPRFAKFPWTTIDNKTLQAWQSGNTGIPLVDAGMRQLWKTGWMHNRVRMVVGSLLIKNLGYHWREGAVWFWDTLVDADLASNTMGWQWVAGSGADAAPYFRVFNPVRQGERFDKEGKYVRYWVPEISKLNNKRIHAPWTATASELQDAQIVLGDTYPYPIVDLSESRKSALASFEKIKS